MCSKKKEKKNIKSDILFLGQGFILGSKHSITKQNKLLSYPVQTIIIIMMMMIIIIIYVAPV